jgi:hypothetical protein
MSSTVDSSASVQLNATTVPFVIVGDQPSGIATSDTQEVEGNDRRNDFFVLRYLLGQNRMKLHEIATQNKSGIEDQTSCQVSKPFIYNSVLSWQRSLRVIMYRPQVLMTNASLNFVGFVNQA